MEIALWIAGAAAALLALAVLWAAIRTERSTGAAEAVVPSTGPTVLARNRSVAAKLHYVDVSPPEPEPARRDAGALLRTRRSRPADAETPLLLVHGLGGTTRHFTSTIMPALAARRRVIAFDRPGYGLSTRPAQGAARLTDQAAILRAALTELGAERPVLVGHSLGGAVALAYALDHPDEVAGLALLAPAVFPFRNKPPLPDETVDHAAMRRTLAYTLGPIMARKNAEQTLAVAFGPQRPPADYASMGGGAYAYRPSQIEAMMEDASILRPELAEMTARYRTLKMPISMLFGKADQILTFEDHGPPLAALAPQVELRTLDDMGHMLPFTAPEAAIALVRDVARSPDALRRWRAA